MSPSDEGLNRGRKRKKKQKKNERAKAEAEDRISRLSDGILHRVMSFMNTKYAVQTCVLSKRWKSLWKSLPFLDFKFNTFPFEGDRKLDREKGDPLLNSFENFITQVLFRRHHTDLVKVCFQPPKSFIYNFSALAVEGLIAYAVDHNVQQLTIQSEYHSDIVVLPESFHFCQSLEKFDAHAKLVKLPKFLVLPALKSLHLWGLEMTENWYNPRNFSGCPNLESLKLIDIRCGDDKTLFVNGPNLKRLELSVNRNDGCSGFKVVIDAPGLMTFQYCGYFPIVCSSDDLGSIDDVCFDIYNRLEIYPVVVKMDVLGLINTFKEFRHAKSITLSLATVQALARFPSLLVENQLTFSNLKYLKIKVQRSCNAIEMPGCVLNFFLNSSTKLRFCQSSKS